MKIEIQNGAFKESKEINVIYRTPENYWRKECNRKFYTDGSITIDGKRYVFPFSNAEYVGIEGLSDKAYEKKQMIMLYIDPVFEQYEINAGFDWDETVAFRSAKGDLKGLVTGTHRRKKLDRIKNEKLSPKHIAEIERETKDESFYEKVLNSLPGQMSDLMRCCYDNGLWVSYEEDSYFCNLDITPNFSLNNASKSPKLFIGGKSLEDSIISIGNKCGVLFNGSSIEKLKKPSAHLLLDEKTVK